LSGRGQLPAHRLPLRRSPRRPPRHRRRHRAADELREQDRRG